MGTSGRIRVSSLLELFTNNLRSGFCNEQLQWSSPPLYIGGMEVTAAPLKESYI